MSALDQVIQRVVETAHPLRIILFGSAARGEATADSDMDLLVVVPEGTRRLETAEKLHMGMFGIPLAVDFVVATPTDLERHSNNIGLIYRSALKEGKLVYAG